MAWDSGFELESAVGVGNILRHAGLGEILIQVLDDGMTPELEILAIDQGPGMRDVEACMRDGHSTGVTVGCGLGAEGPASGDRFSRWEP